MDVRERARGGGNAGMGRQGRRVTVVVLLGAPGAGKGTQADLLAERLGIPHVVDRRPVPDRRA